MEFKLVKELKKANRILLAGAGGGFDIFCGLPLYFYLKDCGKEVWLANLSFTDLYKVSGREITKAAVMVNADTQGPGCYFPEKYLCQWFRQQGEEIEMCCFHRTGPIRILQAYEKLCSELSIDCICLIDGGTDSLMRGDETGLGTPQEDIASISAVNSLEISRKFLVCIGFGVDAYHGVSHFQFLEAVADLTKNGHYLGAHSLLPDMPIVEKYKEAYYFVQNKMPSRPSIVSTSVLSAIEGQYGDYHVTDRTHGSTLWINPIMSLYWGFRLKGVAERCLYLDRIKDALTYAELTMLIEQFREELHVIRSWNSIPV